MKKNGYIANITNQFVRFFGRKRLVVSPTFFFIMNEKLLFGYPQNSEQLQGSD